MSDRMEEDQSLNAPFGARCFLTVNNLWFEGVKINRLNAPFGARCFLTVRRLDPVVRHRARLNAHFGARCFLKRVPMP